MSPSHFDDLLARLAALVGIEPVYFDVFGRRHETPVLIMARVLSELGFDVSSVAALEAAMSSVEEQPWRDGLAPTIVRTAGASSIGLDLFLPADEADHHWHWQIVLEGGETLEASFRPQDLPLCGGRAIDARQMDHRWLEIWQPVGCGYHLLRIVGRRAYEATLIVGPQRCHVPRTLCQDDARQWGLAAHLYTLRSKRNWGIGDFGDLAGLCRATGAQGGVAVATNPFHALFLPHPAKASPYAPSSRLFLNPIYIDVTAVPGFADCPQAQVDGEKLAALRTAALVDYPSVWTTKRRALEALFAQFKRRLASNEIDPDVADFHRFVAEGGEALQNFAAFLVLEELHNTPYAAYVPWPQWPQPYRVPQGPAVAQIIAKQSDRIAFHHYLQYLADRQLRSVADAAKANDGAAWLVRDLALGGSPDGADIWMRPDAFGVNLRCGAPGDDFHPEGQDWGVVPLHPLALRRDYSFFITMLRANMRHAGGLRMDHVIGLQRQFMVPRGERATLGCYINFPFEEMLTILALESERQACMVIGEDLGTVPEGFRERIAARATFGCAVLYFERGEGGRFKAPEEYPRNVAASISTHDLPTLIGYWRGRDIAVRREIGLYSQEAAERAFAERQDDCRKLIAALGQAGFALPTEGASATQEPAGFFEAVHGFLAASPAKLLLAQLDDLCAELDQLNVPGTVDEYPDWRRKVAIALEDPAFAEALARLAHICATRGRGKM